MADVIDLKQYKDLLGAWRWDCPRCDKTHVYEVKQCPCGCYCDGRLLYKKVTEKQIKELTNYFINSTKNKND